MSIKKNKQVQHELLLTEILHTKIGEIDANELDFLFTVLFNYGVINDDGELLLCNEHGVGTQHLDKKFQLLFYLKKLAAIKKHNDTETAIKNYKRKLYHLIQP